MLRGRHIESEQSRQKILQETNGDLWTTLLSSVASSTGKTQSAKTLVILGGGHDGMQQFEEGLRTGSDKDKANVRQSKASIPTACDIGTGYSYFDLMDRDEDEIVARVSLYMVPEPEDPLIEMLQSFLATLQLKDTILCILLDWKRPWSWLREMRCWIRHWKRLVNSQEVLTQTALDDTDDFKSSWQMHLRRFKEDNKEPGASLPLIDSSIVIPLSEGQFDDSLGVSLVCVAQNADNMNNLERLHGVKDEHFDFIQQVIRTVVLKHGGSLVYTTPELNNTDYLPLRLILRNHIPSIYSGIQGKSESDVASVLVRDEVFVPAGWDSWGKIRVLREGFDAEGIAAGWEVDLDETLDPDSEDAEVGAVDVYEEVIQDPRKSRASVSNYFDQQVTAINALDLFQELEQQQWEVGEGTDDQGGSPGSKRKKAVSTRTASAQSNVPEVDSVEAKLRNIKLKTGRQSSQTWTPDSSSDVSRSGDNKDEYVQAFFQNLLTRKSSGRSEPPKD